ncbi:UDP-2,4-diacetamido-2,4,6-trideoxy-beta-L-altropyranose hydrolase [Sulfurimonas sp. NW7]|uniref:UDP-2,4-diacetamido-2,4, 6-trideoxy-beta-L-altropyranose hydrolase n=1 Tax=Sulfurimonas sp. NW7 TaxID=2922727 RepID=UPI003DA87487
MKNNKKILFRADSSSIIGIGHIMRDLVLAKQFKGADITFAIQNLEGNINQKIIDSGYRVEILNSNDFEEFNKLVNSLHVEMVVIDHYEIDFEFEKKLKKYNPNIKLMVLDDTYEKHYCDILLNHNISADEKKYKNLVLKNCKLKCGSKYTLLRDEFITEKKRLQKSPKKKVKITMIFVAMGGADHSNINIKILKVLQNFKDIKVNLVTTTANRNLEAVQKYCKDKKWIKLHINSNKIAKLMGKSDFAIVTPSVTVNEVCFMKLPLIAIKTASNQDDIYKYLKKKKCFVLKQFSESILNIKLNLIIKRIKK